MAPPAPTHQAQFDYHTHGSSGHHQVADDHHYSSYHHQHHHHHHQHTPSDHYLLMPEIPAEEHPQEEWCSWKQHHNTAQRVTTTPPTQMYDEVIPPAEGEFIIKQEIMSEVPPAATPLFQFPDTLGSEEFSEIYTEEGVKCPQNTPVDASIPPPRSSASSICDQISHLMERMPMPHEGSLTFQKNDSIQSSSATTPFQQLEDEWMLEQQQHEQAVIPSVHHNTEQPTQYQLQQMQTQTQKPLVHQVTPIHQQQHQSYQRMYQSQPQQVQQVQQVHHHHHHHPQVHHQQQQAPISYIPQQYYQTQPQQSQQQQVSYNHQAHSSSAITSAIVGGSPYLAGMASSQHYQQQQQRGHYQQQQVISSPHRHPQVHYHQNQMPPHQPLVHQPSSTTSSLSSRTPSQRSTKNKRKYTETASSESEDDEDVGMNGTGAGVDEDDDYEAYSEEPEEDEEEEDEDFVASAASSVAPTRKAIEHQVRPQYHQPSSSSVGSSSNPTRTFQFDAGAPLLQLPGRARCTCEECQHTPSSSHGNPKKKTKRDSEKGSSSSKATNHRLHAQTQVSSIVDRTIRSHLNNLPHMLPSCYTALNDAELVYELHHRVMRDQMTQEALKLVLGCAAGKLSTLLRLTPVPPQPRQTKGGRKAKAPPSSIGAALRKKIQELCWAMDQQFHQVVREKFLKIKGEIQKSMASAAAASQQSVDAAMKAWCESEVLSLCRTQVHHHMFYARSSKSRGIEFHLSPCDTDGPDGQCTHCQGEYVPAPQQGVYGGASSSASVSDSAPGSPLNLAGVKIFGTYIVPSRGRVQYSELCAYLNNPTASLTQDLARTHTIELQLITWLVERGLMTLHLTHKQRQVARSKEMDQMELEEIRMMQGY